jgi:hypothetical protein
MCLTANTGSNSDCDQSGTGGSLLVCDAISSPPTAATPDGTCVKRCADGVCVCVCVRVCVCVCQRVSVRVCVSDCG